MDANNLNTSWKDRVDQFFTYKFKIEQSSADLAAEELLKHFPLVLVRDIMYFS